MAEITKLRDENCKLKRTQVRLVEDLDEEKGLVHNLMGTIKNYEKILRLEATPRCSPSEPDEYFKRHDTWGILYRSIVLLDDEASEMARTVAYMLEKVNRMEKLCENRERKIVGIDMRIERLEAIAFGRKINC